MKKLSKNQPYCSPEVELVNFSTASVLSASGVENMSPFSPLDGDKIFE